MATNKQSKSKEVKVKIIKMKAVKGKQTKDDTTEILHLLLKLQIQYPNWRFGQIIANAVRAYDGRVNCDTFHMSDDEILEGLENLVEDLTKQKNVYKESKNI
jgi:hypothetical protein